MIAETRKTPGTSGLVMDKANDLALTATQKTELLRRKEAFLANPTIAKPWKGTLGKIRQHLRDRRVQKAASNHR